MERLLESPNRNSPGIVQRSGLGTRKKSYQNDYDRDQNVDHQDNADISQQPGFVRRESGRIDGLDAIKGTLKPTLWMMEHETATTQVASTSEENRGEPEETKSDQSDQKSEPYEQETSPIPELLPDLPKFAFVKPLVEWCKENGRVVNDEYFEDAHEFSPFESTHPMT